MQQFGHLALPSAWECCYKIPPAARSEDAAARSQEWLVAASQAIATMHGSGMVALILGKPDAVVEPEPTIVEKTVLVNQSGRPIATYQGLSKTKLASAIWDEKSPRCGEMVRIHRQG